MKNAVEIFQDFVQTRVLNDFNKSIKVEGNEFVETFKISTSTIGVCSLFISDLDVRVTLRFNESKMMFNIIYRFSYKHTQGGSNGYSVDDLYRIDSIGNIKKLG